MVSIYPVKITDPIKATTYTQKTSTEAAVILASISLNAYPMIRGVEIGVPSTYNGKAHSQFLPREAGML